MKHVTPFYILAGVLALTLAGCHKEKPLSEEEKGMEMLNQARQLLSQGDINAARDTIEQMRKHHPLAIEARRQAILTMDSIELQGAIQEGDSLKIQFYTKKIKFDQEKENRE